MSEVHLSAGDEAFKEDDVGDAFYVITKGSAVALKRDPVSGWDKQIGSMEQWSVFGERALLRSETRYATVKATSQELSLLKIASTDMEDAIGGPLKDFVREVHYAALPAPPPPPKLLKKKSSKSSRFLSQKSLQAPTSSRSVPKLQRSATAAALARLMAEHQAQKQEDEAVPAPAADHSDESD